MFNWLTRLRNRVPSSIDRSRWELSTPFLRWSQQDHWTIGNSLEGCLILGATGSGKTSGSGRQIALAMLAAGYGGLVLTAKADERAQWESYCRQTGRLDDLLIVTPGGPWTFNPLAFEATRTGAGSGITENIVNLFAAVLELAERDSGQGGGRDDEGYWRRAARQMIRNFIDLLILSGTRVSIPELYKAVVSAPQSPQQVKSEDWQKSSHCYRLLRQADGRDRSPSQQRDFELVADYLTLEFPALSDKTRSVIVSSFTSMIDVMNRGVLRDLFCGETTFTPDASEKGKIILVDLPVKTYGEVGQIANVLVKHCWQRSIERRDTATSPRPVFLFADEAQHFVSAHHDMMFQTTCRSSRVATVLLSQNVPTIHAAFGGGEKARAEADSLFANLVTKVLHANGDPVTNEWASSLIGKTRQFFMNSSTSGSPRMAISRRYSGVDSSVLPERTCRRAIACMVWMWPGYTSSAVR